MESRFKLLNSNTELSRLISQAQFLSSPLRCDLQCQLPTTFEGFWLEAPRLKEGLHLLAMGRKFGGLSEVPVRLGAPLSQLRCCQAECSQQLVCLGMVGPIAPIHDG